MDGSVRDVVLVCEECGGRMVLGGPLSVWRSGSTSFECKCGAKLTLSHQLDPLEVDNLAETRAGVLYRVDGRGYGSRQRFDNHAAAFHEAKSDLAAIEQSHAQEGSALGGERANRTFGAFPGHRGAVHVQ